MSTTPQTYLEKAKAHCATADKLSDTMRREMRAAFTITLGGKVVRILNGTCRTGTVVALIKRGLVNTATYSDPWSKVNTLTDQGMFVWAALTRRDDFLALAAQKDAEVEAAHTELEADPAVRAAVRQVVDSTPDPIGFDHFSRGATVVRREDGATGRVESRYSDGKLAVVINRTGGVHVAPWHQFTLLSVDAAQPPQVGPSSAPPQGSGRKVEITVSAPYTLIGGGRSGLRPLGKRRDYTAVVEGVRFHNTDKAEIQSAIRRKFGPCVFEFCQEGSAPPAQELETAEEMADTGPQGRDWPKSDRSSVATITSILAANRLPGWCNASALFVGYPPRAVLVHVPAGQDGTRYVQPLADALPYRHARVSFQPKPGSNLSGVVVVHPLHLEESPCPNS